MTKHLDQLQLARRWAMSPRTLERWRWIGGGPRYLKVGKRVVYREDDIEAFEQHRLYNSTKQQVPSAKAMNVEDKR